VPTTGILNRDVLSPAVVVQRGRGKEIVFRADAAFAKAEIYEAPEEQGVKYAIRLPANDMLESCSLGWGSS